MKTPSGLPLGRGGTLRAFLSCALLSFLCAAPWAGGRPPGEGGNGGSSNDPSTNASSPGDEVTSLPVVDGSSGVTLIGSPRLLRAVVRSVGGVGRIDIVRLGRQQFAVTFVGDYRIVLDRPTLVASSVVVVFRGGAAFHGGFGFLQIGSSPAVPVTSERVPLPIVRLASSPRAQGTLVVLDVFGLRVHRAHVEAAFSRNEVTLFQRSTL